MEKSTLGPVEGGRAILPMEGTPTFKSLLFVNGIDQNPTVPLTCKTPRDQKSSKERTGRSWCGNLVVKNSSPLKDPWKCFHKRNFL